MSVFGVFVVHIFPHSDWIWRGTSYLSVFSTNAGQYGPGKLRIRTIFTQCIVRLLINVWNIHGWYITIVTAYNIIKTGLGNKLPDLMFYQCHLLALDIIESNIYNTQVEIPKTKSSKNICRIFDANKVVELIIFSLSL